MIRVLYSAECSTVQKLICNALNFKDRIGNLNLPKICEAFQCIIYTVCSVLYSVLCAQCEIYYTHTIHNVSQCSIIPSEITLPLPPAACSNQTSSGCFEHSKPLVVSFNSNTFRLSRSETKSGQCLIILHNLRGIPFLPPPNFAIKQIELYISVVAL